MYQIHLRFVQSLFNDPLSVWWYSYRSADKSLAQPDHISSDAEVIAAPGTWLDGQPSELLLSGLQKLEFVRCNLFPS